MKVWHRATCHTCRQWTARYVERLTWNGRLQRAEPSQQCADCVDAELRDLGILPTTATNRLLDEATAFGLDCVTRHMPRGDENV